MADEDGHGIARALGQVEGAYRAVDARLTQMQASIEGGNRDAATSRQRMHEKLDETRQDLALTSHRVRVVEQQIESYNNQAKLLAPQTAVDALAIAQEELEKTVKTFSSIKDRITGAVAVLVTLAGVVGAAAAEVWHYWTAKP